MNPVSLHLLRPKCENCQSSDVIVDGVTGDEVCRNCGNVSAGRIITQEAEWRTFVNDDRGNNDSVARSGVRGEDESSVFIGGSKADRERLQRTQNQSSKTFKKDMKILEHLTYVSELCFRLGLPSVVTVSVLVILVQQFC